MRSPSSPDGRSSTGTNLIKVFRTIDQDQQVPAIGSVTGQDVPGRADLGLRVDQLSSG
jgi:hypothetical protein